MPIGIIVPFGTTFFSVVLVGTALKIVLSRAKWQAHHACALLGAPPGSRCLGLSRPKGLEVHLVWRLLPNLWAFPALFLFYKWSKFQRSQSSNKYGKHQSSFNKEYIQKTNNLGYAQYKLSKAEVQL